MEREVFIKRQERKEGELHVFKSQFCEAAEKCGISCVRDYPDDRIDRKIAKLWRLTGLSFHKSHRDSVIVAANGRDLLIRAWHYRHYDIIPMLWDVWPEYQETLFRDLKILKVKTAFVTVRSVAEEISAKYGIKAFWIPEGLDVSVTRPGKILEDRRIDIIELGRLYGKYHGALVPLIESRRIGTWKGHTKERLAFKTAEELYFSLSDAKVIVSFPQCDTNPQRAGNIETLTQRYWESMLSRGVIVGRAPEELIDLIGYNPVVDVDWSNPAKQILSILDDISAYQDLVEKNYKIALKMAPWEKRVETIKTIIQTQLTVYDGI